MPQAREKTNGIVIPRMRRPPADTAGLPSPEQPPAQNPRGRQREESRHDQPARHHAAHRRAVAFPVVAAGGDHDERDLEHREQRQQVDVAPVPGVQRGHVEAERRGEEQRARPGPAEPAVQPVAARAQQHHRGQRQRDEDRADVRPHDRRHLAPFAEAARERRRHGREQHHGGGGEELVEGLRSERVAPRRGGEDGVNRARVRPHRHTARSRLR